MRITYGYVADGALVLLPAGLYAEAIKACQRIDLEAAGPGAAETVKLLQVSF